MLLQNSAVLSHEQKKFFLGQKTAPLRLGNGAENAVLFFLALAEEIVVELFPDVLGNLPPDGAAL